MKYLANVQDDPVYQQANKELLELIARYKEAAMFLRKQAEGIEKKFTEEHKVIFSRLIDKLKENGQLTEFNPNEQCITISNENQIFVKENSESNPLLDLLRALTSN